MGWAVVLRSCIPAHPLTGVPSSSEKLPPAAPCAHAAGHFSALEQIFMHWACAGGGMQVAAKSFSCEFDKPTTDLFVLYCGGEKEDYSSIKITQWLRLMSGVVEEECHYMRRRGLVEWCVRSEV